MYSAIQCKTCILKLYHFWEDLWMKEGEGPGKSHLISGAGSTSHVITSQFSKLCCIDALYKALENLDAIALGQGQAFNAQKQRRAPERSPCCTPIQNSIAESLYAPPEHPHVTLSPAMYDKAWTVRSRLTMC